jgi:hypothetical protein
MIGSTGLGDIEGLHFNGNTLLATDFTNGSTSVYALNTSNASPALVVTTNPGVALARALTLMPNAPAGPVGVFPAGTESSETLSSVNLATGASTSRAFNGATYGLITGMDFASNGVLYALDSLGYEYTVGASTATLTVVGNAGPHFFLDLAIQGASVPEPSSVVMLGTGLIGVIAWGWRTATRNRKAVA